MSQRELTHFAKVALADFMVPARLAQSHLCRLNTRQPLDYYHRYPLPHLLSPSLSLSLHRRGHARPRHRCWQARLLALLPLLCWACAAGYLPVTAAQPAAQLEQHESELRQLRKELKKLQKSLAKKQGAQSATSKEFKRTEIKIGEVAAQGHRITQQQQQLDQQLLQLHREQAELELQSKHQRDAIARHLNNAYRAGDRNALSALFSESSAAELERQLHSLKHINQAHHELLASYSATLARKRQVESAIAARQEQLHDNQQQLAEQFQQLNALQQKRSKVLKRLAQEIGGAQQRVAKLHDEQQALQELVGGMARLQRERQAQAEQDAKKRELDWRRENQNIDSERDNMDQHPTASAPAAAGFANAKGQLPWPVRGKREHNFGKIRSDSAIKAQGVTIAAPGGAVVQSIYSGQVIFADWFGGQGLLAIIDHGDGYWSLYGHNQSLLKSVGARVSAGEAIATVGNSGGRDEPALYFEIRAQGKPSDPAQWCSSS